MEIQYYINSNLDIDNQGKIQLIRTNSLDCKKDKVNLYLDTELGSIPFLQYGNTLKLSIFTILNDSQVSRVMSDLTDTLNNKFGLNIINSNYDINGNEMILNFNLSNNEIIQITK